MGDAFVNPYTFVPLPKGRPQREAPHGHLGNAKRLSGTLTVSIETVTPLLIRGFGSDTSPQLPTRPDGTPFIPGSSLKGAIRSLHETMTGSCLRVFDDEFVPRYRDPVEWSKDRVLAVVTVPPQGDEPPQVRLCKAKPKERLSAKQLHEIYQRRRLLSGSRFTRKNGQFEPKNDGEWVLFLSNRREDDDAYHGHLRMLRNAKAGDQGKLVPQPVWDRFRKLVEDTDDDRTGLREACGKPVIDVTVPRPKKDGAGEDFMTGHRFIASAVLLPNQPVWVELNDQDEITDLGLAMAWRHHGATPAGERVREFGPCTSDSELCPSCRLFGSADLSGKPDDPELADLAMQRSYRGHVRFGDALADAPVEPESHTLPPLGVPRPGSGQFYLHNDGFEGKAARGKQQPLREWGSRADRKPRELRGRKYYWHTSEFNGRQKARPHQKDSEMVSEAVAFPGGSKFTATITFTDIDHAQLGGLLAALLPGRALGEDKALQHIGGGRPLGFGSSRITLVEGKMWANGSRYGCDSAEQTFAVDALLTSFRDSQPERLRGTIWPQISEVLRQDSVDPEKVWYPPGALWKQRESEKFDTGFEFWKQTSGYGDHQLTSLPHVDPGSKQSHELPVIVENSEQKGRS